MPAVSLPIDEVMPDILAPLAAGRDVVLQAAPGAGKTPAVITDRRVTQSTTPSARYITATAITLSTYSTARNTTPT